MIISINLSDGTNLEGTLDKENGTYTGCVRVVNAVGRDALCYIYCSADISGDELKIKLYIPGNGDVFGTPVPLPTKTRQVFHYVDDEHIVHSITLPMTLDGVIDGDTILARTSYEGMLGHIKHDTAEITIG